jgi:hypothetical protein
MYLFNFFKNIIIERRLKNANIKSLFDYYFFDLKYYLHRDASINEFSSLLGLSIEEIEAFTKTNYNSTFQAIIDNHRYKFFIKELWSPINSNLPIESIIKISGFESNSSFAQFLKEKDNNMYLLLNI